MNQKKSADFYERKYQNEKEPWGYSGFAIENLRHEFVVKTACLLKPKYLRILDAGCGKGNLTFLFNGLADEITGIDISPTAIKQADFNREIKFNGKESSCFILKPGNILTEDFPENHFDLILICDGIEEWFENEKDKMDVLVKTEKLLMPNGYAILTDYQKPKHFNEFVNFISRSPLNVVKTLPLNDRLSYQFNSWFKMGENTKIVKWIYKNRIIAKLLMKISSLFGINGSKHFCVVVKKKN